MQVASSDNSGQTSHLTYNNTCPVPVSKAQFNQLRCNVVGHNEVITKVSCSQQPQTVNQSYFSGLVYRYDSRNIQQIENAGGFYPKTQRSQDNPVLYKDVIRVGVRKNARSKSLKRLADFNPNVYSACCEGIVATSKLINYSNGIPSLNIKTRELCQYKYMIDSEVNHIFGLDPDQFTIITTEDGDMKTNSYEVCFENPLPTECIVGYFQNEDYSTFYTNPNYKGYFSWKAEDVVSSYKQSYGVTAPSQTRLLTSQATASNNTGLTTEASISRTGQPFRFEL